MVQGGCPQGTGTGGPGYRFEDETNNGLRHERGVLSMANAGPEHQRQPVLHHPRARAWLDGKHTVFGKVLEGLDVVDVDASRATTIDRVKIEGDAGVRAGRQGRPRGRVEQDPGGLSSQVVNERGANRAPFFVAAGASRALS